MAKATFMILCRDEGDKAACERTKALMRDCRVSDSPHNAAHNHTGEREFETADDAVERMDELIRLAGHDVLDIKVKVEF